jgi:hypothetical protein
MLIGTSIRTPGPSESREPSEAAPSNRRTIGGHDGLRSRPAVVADRTSPSDHHPARAVLALTAAQYRRCELYKAIGPRPERPRPLLLAGAHGPKFARMRPPWRRPLGSPPQESQVAPPRRLLRRFVFRISSGAGNEVPHAFLGARILEGIIEVLWPAGGGVVKKHALDAGGPLENRADRSSPHPHSRNERRPNWITHPERLSHRSKSVGASQGR